MTRTLLSAAACALTLLVGACTSADENSAYIPASGAPGPNAHPNFPNYEAHQSPTIDALRNVSAERRDEFCRTYCAEELDWPADQFVKSSIEDFFQTPESTDLRCDYSETGTDIGGSERHLGRWIVEQCQRRGLRNCYWSINYGRQHAGRVACVRAVFEK